jgi:hypothetical protein
VSNHIDIELIKENYARMPDEQLVHIAKNEANSMTPEGQEIILSELKKRKLDPGLSASVAIQNKEYSPDEINAYCEMVRHLDCPRCGSSVLPLNSTATITVISFILLSTKKTSTVIACPNCLDFATGKAFVLSVLFGWWEIPWGPLRTVKAIQFNLKMGRKNHDSDTRDEFKNAVTSNIGKIALYKNNKPELQAILANLGKSSIN